MNGSTNDLWHIEEGREMDGGREAERERERERERVGISIDFDITKLQANPNQKSEGQVKNLLNKTYCVYANKTQDLINVRKSALWDFS